MIGRYDPRTLMFLMQMSKTFSQRRLLKLQNKDLFQQHL